MVRPRDDVLVSVGRDHGECWRLNEPRQMRLVLADQLERLNVARRDVEGRRPLQHPDKLTAHVLSCAMDARARGTQRHERAKREHRQDQPEYVAVAQHSGC